MDLEDAVYIHNGILLSHKKNEIMPFAATWMELETLILSEVSQKERQIPYVFTYIWSLIKGTNESFHRKETHGFGEQTCGCQGGRGGNGTDWEPRINRCKLSYMEWISNGILLYSTGNYI